MTGLLVVAALRTERIALAGVDATVERCGMGPRRVRRWLPKLDPLNPAAVVMAGVAGGLDPALRAGDVVVGTEVQDLEGTVPVPAGAPLVAELRRLGLRVHHGPIVTVDKLELGHAHRTALAANGAIAVDMESATLVRGVHARPGPVPVAVVRVIVDTVDTPLLRLRTVPAGIRALLVLRRVGDALPGWARADAVR